MGRGRPKKETLTKLTDKQERYLDCLQKSLGLISIASKKANISMRSHYDWMNEESVRGDLFRERVNEIMESQGDFVESQLFKNIKNGDPSSTIFYCKTKLRSRGYNQTIDTNVNIETASDTDVANAVTNLMSGIDYKVDEDDDAEEVTDDEEVS